MYPAVQAERARLCFTALLGSNDVFCLSVLFFQFLGGRDAVKRCVGQEERMREPGAEIEMDWL